MVSQLFNGSPSASLPLKAPVRRTVSTTGRVFVLFALLAGFALDAAAANTYRYRDDQGRIVHANTVPPQFVKNGYEVLNERGVVIQVVPRALTPAELAAQEAVREEQEAAEALVRAREEADRMLMRLFRSPDEIARKRDERVTIIEGQLTALLASLAKVEAEVTRLQGVVAAQSGEGKTPPAQTVETLRIQQDEMNRLLTQRDRLQNDRDTAVSDAERDMKRLAELMGLPPESAEETATE